MDQWVAKQIQTIEETASAVLYNDNYEYQYVFGYLAQQMKQNEGNTYYLCLPDGTLIDGSGWIPGDDFVATERGWYKDAVSKDGLCISEAYIDARTGNMVITISTPLKDGVLLGVLASDIYIDYLIDVISGVEIGADSYAFLLDDQGNILTHTDQAYLPSAEEGFTNIEQILDGKLSTILAQDKPTIEKRKTTDFDGVERLFYFDTIEEPGWKVGLALSAQETSKTVNTVISYNHPDYRYDCAGIVCFLSYCQFDFATY